MRERYPNVLIMGARASQGMLGEHFVEPAITEAEGVRPNIVFYDPDPTVTLREDVLPHLRAGIQRGDVHLTHTMPQNEFDIVAVVTSSQQHTPAIRAALETHRTPPFFILDKPLATTWNEVAQLREVQPWIQPASVTNEPYLFSHGMEIMKENMRYQEAIGNPATEVRVWSSKRRHRTNPHGDLGPFGVELPHTHGGASHLVGDTLGLHPNIAIEENIYFADVDEIPNNDANYLRFRSGEKLIHVTQGLGRFAMDGYGNMIRNDQPPKVRRASLRFENGEYIELDINTAFPSPRTDVQGYSTIWYFDANGEITNEIVVDDDPRRDLARYAFRRAKDRTLPNIPRVSMSETLERSEALLYLRENTEVRHGISL